jgi:hypothetical protein
MRAMRVVAPRVGGACGESRRAGDFGCGHRVGRRPLSRLRRQLPARRGAAQGRGDVGSRTFGVPRLAGDRSAERIRGSVSDSAALGFARSPSRSPTPQSPSATAPRKAGSGSGAWPPPHDLHPWLNVITKARRPPCVASAARSSPLAQRHHESKEAPLRGLRRTIFTPGSTSSRKQGGPLAGPPPRSSQYVGNPTPGCGGTLRRTPKIV